jgi:NAD(P)H dehydrogenase (quinone)
LRIRPSAGASWHSWDSGADKVIVGDMLDASVLRSAVDGVRSIYHICPNMHPDEVNIGGLVINAAREGGVEHLVYHSVLHPQTEKMNHHWQKMRVEEMIFESGIPFTILQSAPYMQNLLAGWKSIMENDVLRVPYSIHAKFSFVDLEDIAEAAKIVLTEAGHNNATYELSGTLPMSHAEVAEVMNRVLKHDIHAEEEEVEGWKRRVGQGSMNEYTLENLVRMFEYYDQFGLVGNTNILKWLLKREPTSLDSFINRI